MAKGEPHHWTSLGGDAQQGALTVMFDGPRVNSTYDPMRKQGAILLGNGGDNSNSSQGTFYEGAVTASGTFPTDATDQLVQANVVARAMTCSGSAWRRHRRSTPRAFRRFRRATAQDTTVTFTNTTGVARDGPGAGAYLCPASSGPRSFRARRERSKTFTDTVAPGASVSATFTVTSGPEAFNGDLVASASWTDAANGRKQTDTMAEKVRSAAR